MGGAGYPASPLWPRGYKFKAPAAVEQLKPGPDLDARRGRADYREVLDRIVPG
jgi:hypothetical protein